MSPQKKKTAGQKKKGRKSAPKKARAPKQAAAEAKSAPEVRPAPTLTDRLTDLMEQVAAGAVRLMVDSGGREFGSWLPEANRMRQETGAYLRELRELAGLTVDDLARAIELTDKTLLEAVEEGTATLSFELVLRLAAILARHDPVPFITRLARTYNPLLWQMLEDWGIGRLPVQMVREREFVNIMRGHDEVRALSDEDFERLLTFTRSAFETALHFMRAHQEPGAPDPEP
jgi:transcriptional regulator with XRE-family HTH domain